MCMNKRSELFWIKKPKTSPFERVKSLKVTKVLTRKWNSSNCLMKINKKSELPGCIIGLLRWAAKMFGDVLLTWSWIAARERSGGIEDGWGWPPDIEVETDGWWPWEFGAPEDGIFIGIGNRGCCISGPADFGVRGGVGGCPPPDGEFEFPRRAEERNPGGNDPRGPKLLLEFGESDEEAGGEESFSGRNDQDQDQVNSSNQVYSSTLSWVNSSNQVNSSRLGWV